MSSLLTGSDARAVMADNTVALRATRKAMALLFWNAANRSEGNESTEYADIEALAHLLEAKSEARASRGDYEGAVNRSLDALALGDLLRHCGGLLATRNVCQIESPAAQQVWSLIENSIEVAQPRLVSGWRR